MAIPSSPEEPSKGTKLSCTLERQCSFFTAALDMANELQRKGNRIGGWAEGVRRERKCQLHNKQGNDPVTSGRRLFCYLTFVSCLCLRSGELQCFTSQCGKVMNNSSFIRWDTFSESSLEVSNNTTWELRLCFMQTYSTAVQPNDAETFPHVRCAFCRLTLCFYVNTQDRS